MGKKEEEEKDRTNKYIDCAEQDLDIERTIKITIALNPSNQQEFSKKVEDAFRDPQERLSACWTIFRATAKSDDEEERMHFLKVLSVIWPEEAAFMEGMRN